MTVHTWDWVLLRRVCEREAARILHGTSSDLDDAVQEALARAWRRRRACRSPRAPEAWVAQIARREALRQAARGSRRMQLEPLDDEVVVAAAAEDDLVAAAVDVRRAMRALGTADRRLVALRYLDDLTHRTIADQLGQSVANVKVRLHRARRRLRTALEPADAAARGYGTR